MTPIVYVLPVILCVVFVVVVVVEASSVDYFVNLITVERENALDYKLPENASEYETADEEHYYGEYDYIIVGAGSSGSVLANRLSENGKWNILLLEAGDLENNFTDIPAMRYASEFTKYNWGFKTTPQKTACLGSINKTCPIARGKGVGGSTLLSSLTYIRPNKHDFERWESEGNHGWSYNEILPYFKKSEKSQIPNGEEEFHGKEGVLNVEYRSPQSPHLKAFLEANVELERHIVDYNGKTQIGVSATQYNTLFGVRETNAKTFLTPALQRANLKLLINAYVTKILFDEHAQATGVEFSYKTKRHTAFVKKEVIVSAGPIMSPQILQLSGVGPKKLLAKHHIPVVADLPVGKHLSDHPIFYGLYFETNYTEPIKSLEEYVKEYLNGVGPLTMPGNNQGLGFYRTHLARYPHTPDLQMVLIASNSSDEFTAKSLNLNEDTEDALFGDSDPTKEIAILPSVLQPLSRGKVEIQSKNPFHYPKIDLNLLANLSDVDTLYEAIQMVFEIVDTEPFEKLGVQYSPSPLTACEDHEFLSRDYWYCAIRHLTLGSGNLSGTCKMGPHPKKGSVVDNKFRVHSTRNLRIIDASVFPFPLSGDYNTASVLIAERASDFIKEDQNEVPS